MQNEIRDLIDHAVEHLVIITLDEDQLGQRLRKMSDAERTEVVYYMHDRIIMHGGLPHTRRVRIEKIEEYVGHLIGVADWHVQRQELHDLADELNEYDYSIFDDDYLDEALGDLDE